MGNMNLVTGYRGAAHVTADDHGSLYAGIFGEGNYVLDRGKKLAATAVSSNKINIADGDLILQGRHGRISPGSTVSVTIQNGSQGVKRHDLIVARYTRNASTSVEDMTIAVIKGTATTGMPSDPAHTTGDILNEQAETADFPLYRVVLNGINIEKIEQLFALASFPLLDEHGKLQTATMPDEVPLLNEDGKLPNGFLEENTFFVSYNGIYHSVDKTYQEIKEALDAKKICILVDGFTIARGQMPIGSEEIHFVERRNGYFANRYIITPEEPNYVTVEELYDPPVFKTVLTKNGEDYVVDNKADAIVSAFNSGKHCVLVYGAQVYHLSAYNENGTTVIFDSINYVPGSDGTAIKVYIDKFLIGSKQNKAGRQQYKLDALGYTSGINFG